MSVVPISAKTPCSLESTTRMRIRPATSFLQGTNNLDYRSCYCSSYADPDLFGDLVTVPNAFCNFTCEGDPTSHCGGLTTTDDISAGEPGSARLYKLQQNEEQRMASAGSVKRSTPNFESRLVTNNGTVVDYDGPVALLTMYINTAALVDAMSQNDTNSSTSTTSAYHVASITAGGRGVSSTSLIIAMDSSTSIPETIISSIASTTMPSMPIDTAIDSGHFPDAVYTHDNKVFGFYGCAWPIVGSGLANSFILAEDSPEMDMKLCGSEYCPDDLYFGVYDT
jgi:hypothetical protein